ncbi:MAG TPA: tripartite tricarboxylate transporter substrate binding protein [Xanthobacteraceae bacterium]|jgi:tripartite-type tricarboxylate transporter receptor subunit TctC|nr:tripartite tricarboxylate transporter substrate binding protein [Xanthobacteraceae bacterium]
MVVGFPASNASDIVARLAGQKLSERLGQSFIVENRPGAGGNIAVEFVVNAGPDGYTLLAASTSAAINATLYEHLSFNFLRDIAPVAGVARAPYVLVVTPAFPATTVAEFTAYAKANPGKINMASAGNGSLSHLCGELFKTMAGIDMVHVPYRTSFLPDLFAGQIQVVFSPISQSIEYVRSGKLRALAVTSATRQPSLPDIPAVAEFVPGYEASGWYGIGAPKNTPADIVVSLNTAMNSTLAEADMKTRLNELGAVPMPTTPAEFASFLAADTEKWGKVIRAADIKPE